LARACGVAMKLNVTVDVPLTLDQLAGLFIELDDDSQTQFFVKVAALMQSWTPHERNMQAFHIGRHLRDCKCSTADARELVAEIYDAMSGPTEGEIT
jgi:hypothetical protein